MSAFSRVNTNGSTTLDGKQDGELQRSLNSLCQEIMNTKILHKPGTNNNVSLNDPNPFIFNWSTKLDKEVPKQSASLQDRLYFNTNSIQVHGERQQKIGFEKQDKKKSLTAPNCAFAGNFIKPLPVVTANPLATGSDLDCRKACKAQREVRYGTKDKLCT